MNDTGVGVISFTCLDNCKAYIGAIAIILLGSYYIFLHSFVFYLICSVVLWNGILAILFLWLSLKFPPNLKGILFYIQVWGVV